MLIITNSNKNKKMNTDTISSSSEFTPRYSIAPGKTIREELEYRGISQKEFATRMGLDAATVNRVIQGTAPITVETAGKLENVLSIPASYWMNMELNYRKSLQGRNKEEQKEARRFTARFPYNELVRRNVCPASNDAVVRRESLLRFFGVSDETAYGETYLSLYEGAARVGASRSWDADAFATWLRLGEKKAELIQTASFSREKLRNALGEIRRCMNRAPREAWQKICAILREVGVALIVVPEIGKSHVHGFSRFLKPDKALVQLSLRGRRVASFWFSLFHELAHLILHGKKKVFVNIDTDEKYEAAQSDSEEREANQFSINMVFSDRELLDFFQYAPTIRSMEAFAKKQGVAVDVVLSRLQAIGKVPYNRFPRQREMIQVEDFQD